MSKISIRLPKDLKDRGADFLDTAEKRYADIAASGRTVPWRAMRAYLESRVAGEPAPRPTARKRIPALSRS